jgi:hypothetical protein
MPQNPLRLSETTKSLSFNYLNLIEIIAMHKVNRVWSAVAKEVLARATATDQYDKEIINKVSRSESTALSALDNPVLREKLCIDPLEGAFAVGIKGQTLFTAIQAHPNVLQHYHVQAAQHRARSVRGHE